MATIESAGKKITLKDGSEIKAACEELGVTFGCHHGECGMCLIQILEGKENLTDLTEAEKIMGMDGEKRLACQCKIKKGTVKIDWG